MRILFVASMYPHAGMPYSGTFIQKCMVAVRDLGHEIVGLVPRPYFPIPSFLYPRLKTYAQIPKYSEIDGFPVHRPNQLQVPFFKVDWQQHQGSYLQMKSVAQRLHAKHNFEAILSFNLRSAGGLAWRLGKLLGIPSAGWAFGTDVRAPLDSVVAIDLRKTVESLDLCFYQSSELRDCGRRYLPPDADFDLQRHVVLPHGIPPLTPADAQAGEQIRAKYGIPRDATLILFLSRVAKAKGIFELLEAFQHARQKCENLWCLCVGASPGFDDSEKLRQAAEQAGVSQRFLVVPSCQPNEVPAYQAAADLFAFPSHNEGMPNALLEAMLLGTPAIAYEIPPILDIQDHDECLRIVPLQNAIALGEAITELANDKTQRDALARAARTVAQEKFDVRTNMRRAIELLAETTANS